MVKVAERWVPLPRDEPGELVPLRVVLMTQAGEQMKCCTLADTERSRQRDRCDATQTRGARRGVRLEKLGARRPGHLPGAAPRVSVKETAR